MPIFTVLQPFKDVAGRFIDPVTNLGTVVFKNLKAGNVMRQYRIPANPKSTEQVKQRGYFAAASAAYKGNSTAECAAWIALAAEMERTNSLGTSYKYSGINVHNTVNVFRQMNGQALTKVAPAFADIPIPITSLTSFAITGGTLTVVVNCTGLADGALVFIRITPSIARQSRLARVNELRVPDATLTTCFHAVATNVCTFTITPDLVVPVTGQYCGLQLTAMSAAYLPREPLFIPQQLVG